MGKGDRFWRVEAQKSALKAAEAGGQIADNMEVRAKLMERVHAGEITLEQAQAELKRIKRGAKAAGLTTRAEAFRRG
jgi:predicted XRE-type DNA-binding protein